MKKKVLFLILAAYFSLSDAFAGYNPTAYYTVDGDPMETTDAIMDAQAPLEVTFKANPDEDNPSVGYEWRFRRSEEQQPFMTRHEETTVFTFSESGQTIVELYITENGETDDVPVATITVSISNSFLEMPNAFSPNGDGINDIYKAKEGYQSIVEFHAYIFNRWGQKLYDWDDPAGGWDGKYKGKDVAQGVYYCLVKAKGADGRNYSIKKDVNLLRGYTEETTTNE